MASQSSNEEYEHAIKLTNFQNLRDGRVGFQAENKPVEDEWGSALEAFYAALALKKFNNQTLLDLYAKTAAANDVQMSDFMEAT
ncbi:unnamed protein product [Heligmosomoides polygyrus]|uniref:Ferritin n=1 Tax=Heligmosomoides polygyrus TaxID=6339 RepID=A0A183FDM1_HELPZ|nr:unnamed protein product [Heligmosomoides polygyrus]